MLKKINIAQSNLNIKLFIAKIIFPIFGNRKFTLKCRISLLWITFL